jgi:hypothetical protein
MQLILKLVMGNIPQHRKWVMYFHVKQILAGKVQQARPAIG